MSTDFAFVLTTLPLDMDPNAFARNLVNEGLAACVNVHAPMTSIYRWEGKVQEDGERQLTIKTTVDRVPALQTQIIKLHKYGTPEFIVLPIVDGSHAYLDWLRTSTA